MAAQSLQNLYQTLRLVPSFGDFLAFQFAIDLNYSELFGFSEMDFVVAGPGARSGITKAFEERGGLSDEQIITEVALAAQREFQARGLQFRSLWGRELQLVDCQNIFCEIDKYSRIAFPDVAGKGRTRIKRRYTSSKPAVPQWYPPKWALDTNRKDF